MTAQRETQHGQSEIDHVTELVGRLLDGQLQDDGRAELNRLLRESPDAVGTYHELMDLDAALSAIYPGQVFLDGLSEASDAVDAVDAGRFESAARIAPAGSGASTDPRPQRWLPLAAAACFAAVWVLGFGSARLLRTPDASQPSAGRVAEWPVAQSGEQPSDIADADRQIAGHAVLRRAVDVDWPAGAPVREGELLPAGTFAFDAGLVEVDLFCGASLLLEGPVSLTFVSDWVVELHQGRVRASVPPAARGFVVKTGQTEVYDLGTEFAMQVSKGSARVEVLDGEVELRGGPGDGRLLTQGESAILDGDRGDAASLASIATGGDLDTKRSVAMAERIGRWQAASAELAQDERLIAYFPIAGEVGAKIDGREIANRAIAGGSTDSDARLIGLVGRDPGRFGQAGAGLNFSRPGSRARVLLDGAYEAFTFACWVRIDALDHRYNALFMGDGYENGEPHWQIRDDGRMMFSVMVDDSQIVEVVSPVTKQTVRDAGLHRVYYTEPVWDVSKGGQWLHLAAVYDPKKRQVRQYVNGERVTGEPIADRYRIESLRIGPAEIGNWGQPFRESPWFAVRNLNGTIDELAIFDAALSDDEISTLHEQGKPLGY